MSHFQTLFERVRDRHRRAASRQPWITAKNDRTVWTDDLARDVRYAARRGPGSFSHHSYPNDLDISQRTTTLDGVYAFPLFPEKLSWTMPNGDRGGVERIYGAFVTTNYFALLGAVPAAGRLFIASDGDQGRTAPIVVVNL